MQTDKEAIPFTQYMLPNGRREPVEIWRPLDVAARAKAILDKGHRFECEVLTTGRVSLTITGKDESGEERDLDIEVCANGPGVLDAVDRLITRFPAEH